MNAGDMNHEEGPRPSTGTTEPMCHTNAAPNQSAVSSQQSDALDEGGRDREAERRALAPTGGYDIVNGIAQRSLGDLLRALFGGYNYPCEDFGLDVLDTLAGDLDVLQEALKHKECGNDEGMAEHVYRLRMKAAIGAELARRLDDASQEGAA
jgi:hypothetical protein